MLQIAKPGDEIAVRVTLSESDRPDPGATIVLRGRGLFIDQTLVFDAGRRQMRDLKVKLAATALPGRHVFWVHTTDRVGPEPTDAYFAVDVAPQ